MGMVSTGLSGGPKPAKMMAFSLVLKPERRVRPDFEKTVILKVKLGVFCQLKHIIYKNNITNMCVFHVFPLYIMYKRHMHLFLSPYVFNFMQKKKNVYPIN